jgi:hypothetical protein
MNDADRRNNGKYGFGGCLRGWGMTGGHGDIRLSSAPIFSMNLCGKRLYDAGFSFPPS